LYQNGILPVLIVVAAKMQTDPARELAVLTSSSYTEVAKEGWLVVPWEKRKKLHRMERAEDEG
jgi:hypothetical protein